MSKRNTIILGAAGRDFHNFNTFFKHNDNYNIVAFTATQIPEIDGRRYPAGLAGDMYPNGIPIYPEDDLHILIKRFNVHDCVFSYSDVSYEKVMSMGAVVQAAGANFILLGPEETMIKSSKPVISVCAVRTGCGKSQTSRKIIELLIQRGKKVIAIRHPMPYGNLLNQKVQRFAQIDDLKKHNCTIEEMEEYEPHIVRGNVIYAGVDYEAILREAENDIDGCDVIVWDGGNNDMPFYNTDLMITVTDPHRAGHELTYYPSEVNLRMADVVIINKIDSADQDDIEKLRENIASVNSGAIVIEANSPIRVDDAGIIKNKKVLVVEDGPTLTHGEMKFGAGVVAAQRFGASEIIDPRPYLVGSLGETFEKYPEIGPILPAMGYGKKQLHDLERTIQNTECEGVIIATPIDLSREIKIHKPCTRVYYSLEEVGEPILGEVLDKFLKEHENNF
jgi:predicted GTPase